MQIQSHGEFEPSSHQPIEYGLQKILDRLVQSMERDALIRQTTHKLRESLQVDRVILYYFYWQWHGQVTFESVSATRYSILGSTGPDQCFNDEYANLYLAGRIKAVNDIESEPISTCHRDFLRSLQIRANLVAPVLVPKGLWGLLIAHQCRSPHSWTAENIEQIKTAAHQLATSTYILES